MKVTLNWLKEYVDFGWPPEELGERLTMLGIEVEGMQKLGPEFEGIVVAEVLTRDKHPNADKLTVCRVQDGQGERQIVCGATNFQAGDKVPLILPGATLPAPAGEKPLTIKVGRIRGVESQGMLCSPKELGLSEDAQGLYVLPAEAPVGQPFAQFMGRDKPDVVYDLEITPNRPDLNSVIGIAREISASTGNPLRLPDPGRLGASPSGAAPDAQPGIDHYVAVRIEDAALCPRYTARVVRGVKVGASPAWLRQTLEKVGIRSISNVVDVTNYVMLETGQPLHAFDYHLLAKQGENKPTIVVRRAADGEPFTTLDDQERLLNSDMLLIADETKGIALAGIMGGQNTEINDRTEDVLIESAYFDPRNIRRTSKALGVRSESSYRFERGCDPGISDWASRRAAQLILETAGGRLAPGVVDACPKPVAAREITLRHAKTDALLGVTVPAQEQMDILRRLGLELLTQSSEDSSTYRIPTFRVDLKREADLIEEVCRLYGVDRLRATPPRGAFGNNEHDPVHDGWAEVRRLLTGMGLDEAQGQTLIAAEAAQQAAPQEQMVRLAYPLSSDMNVLRPSLLPGLLDTLRHNLHHQNGDLALFELGRVFDQKEGVLREHGRLAVALTGRKHPLFWEKNDGSSMFDLYDLKGVLEELLDQLGIRGATYARLDQPSTLFFEPAAIQVGTQRLGELGSLSPLLAKQYDLRDPALLAELDLGLLLSLREPIKSFEPWPAFPASRRDIAMFVPETVTHQAVLEAVRQAKPKYLERTDLFDVFRGRNVPSGQKSMAYAFLYRSPERTLTDAEVNAEHEKIVGQFKSQLQAAVREG